jgi:DNA-binding response OmpR family regulator
MARILVVDDSDHFREGITLVLETAGHTVIQLADGRGVESVLAENDIDLVLMDIVMPDRGGVETMMDIRPQLEDLKVILMTGKVPRESEAFRSLSKLFGGYTILYKPVRRDELLEAVAAAL